MSKNSLSNANIQQKIILLLYLEELYLSNTHGAQIENFPSMLKILDFSGVMIRDFEKIHLPESLLEVDFSNDRIDYTNFYKLKLPSGLKKLDLSSTYMKSDILPNLKLPKTLTHLILDNNDELFYVDLPNLDKGQNLHVSLFQNRTENIKVGNLQFHMEGMH